MESLFNNFQALSLLTILFFLIDFTYKIITEKGVKEENETCDQFKILKLVKKRFNWDSRNIGKIPRNEVMTLI